MTLLRILLLSAVLVGLGSAVPSERKGPNDSTTDSDISQYLTAHNRVRAQHGANPLSWDEELASKAREWANRCVFEHSGGKLGRYGENLAAGTGMDYDIPVAVKTWTDEAASYDPHHPKYSHYTQVVWKATTHLGCGVAICDGIFPPQYGPARYYVCEYSPPGNISGEFDDNVQP